MRRTEWTALLADSDENHQVLWEALGAREVIPAAWMTDTHRTFACSRCVTGTCGECCVGLVRYPNHDHTLDRVVEHLDTMIAAEALVGELHRDLDWTFPWAHEAPGSSRRQFRVVWSPIPPPTPGVLTGSPRGGTHLETLKGSHVVRAPYGEVLRRSEPAATLRELGVYVHSLWALDGAGAVLEIPYARS